MKNENHQNNIEKIKSIIEERDQRFAPKGGSVTLAGVEDGVVRIAPEGFCWR